MGAELDRLLAKSDGERLPTHLKATLDAALLVKARLGKLPNLPPEIADRFWTAVLLAALVHDTGKFLDGFQAMLTIGLPWGRRHEVASLGFVHRLITDPVMREWVGLGVATHHRPLWSADGDRSLRSRHGGKEEQEFIAEFGTYNATGVAQLADWLQHEANTAGLLLGGDLRSPDDVLPAAFQLFGQLQTKWGEEAIIAPDRGLAAILVQGAVTMADHISSAHGVLHTRQPLRSTWADRFRERRALFKHQEQAATVVGHLLCRAPTGRGKTETAFLWAITQLADIAARTGGTPRFFYLLPYLAAINAMWHRATHDEEGIANPDEVGVAHSRSGSFYLSVSLACEDAPKHVLAWKAKARAAASRLFRETIRIGTPYQVLRGALAGPTHSSVLLDAANSVFVLDELHAYEPRRLGMILAATQTWVQLGGRVAVLSATMPDQMVDLIAEILPGLTVIDAYEDLTPRHRIHMHDDHLTAPATIDAIRSRLQSGEAVLVVANNIADAQFIHDQLTDETVALHGSDAVHQLHSKYRRMDRATIEDAIIARHGSRRPRVAGLTVTTQVCEVSLDVSFDILFTSAAPLEALAQRFGRVNRLGLLPPVDVHICAPDYRERKNPPSGVFADGVYPAAPVRAAWEILAENNGKPVDEHQITLWLTRVYAGDWGQRWRTEVENGRHDFERDILTFSAPFDDRSDHERQFEQLFDGTEAILSSDRDAYASELKAGRLLAEQYLIPLPAWASGLSTYDKELRVAIIEGDYTTDAGLTAIHKKTANEYRLGEVF